MKHPCIVELIACLERKYSETYVPYGTSENEELGNCFRITGIDATFSALCLTDTPTGFYDIQIESYPPGDYVYTDTVNLADILALVRKYKAPMNDWPVNES
jgi:hypothetical protein